MLRVFGNQPLHEEQVSYRQAAQHLSTFIVAATDDQLFVVVSASTREGARAVIQQCRADRNIQALPTVVMQPWRYARNAEDLRTALVAHLIKQTQDGGRTQLSRELTSVKQERVSELYKWLQERDWSPVMQAELDAWLEVWLQSLNRQPLLLVVEGLEECDKQDQRLCREVLYRLLNYERVILLRDAQSKGDAVVAWPVHVTVEVPPLSPGTFESLVVKLWKTAGIIVEPKTAEEAARLALWARVLRDVAYPDASKARRIINDMSTACMQALWHLGMSSDKQPRDLLGPLTDPEKPLAKMCFMVLLAHRFPDLTDRLQTSVNGADIVIRLALWSQMSVETTDKEADAIKEKNFGRLTDATWSAILKDKAIARFFRDCVGGDEPLVKVLGGRHEWASYLWVGRGARVDEKVTLSTPSLLSIEWMRLGLLRTLPTPGGVPVNRREADAIRDSDDWERMGEWALSASEGAQVPREAEEIARLGVARARRGNDDAGELRARGALAVVLARSGQGQEAEQQLRLAGLLADMDKIDITRLSEFRALVAQATGDAQTQELWRGTWRQARSVGLEDVAARAARALLSLASHSAKVDRSSAPSKRCRVFVSYRHLDRVPASAVKSALDELSNCEVFYDDKIVGGEAWLGVLGNELASADIAVMLISKSFVARRAGGAPDDLKDDICYFEAIRVEERRQANKLRLVHANLDGATLPLRLEWTHGPRIVQRSWPKSDRAVSGDLTPNEASELAAAVAADVGRHATQLLAARGPEPNETSVGV